MSGSGRVGKVHTYIHTLRPTQEGMVGRQSLFLTDGYTRALFKRNGIGSF